MKGHSKVIAICVVIALSAISRVAIAETVKRQGIACVSEELLSEGTRYIIKKDRDGLVQLERNGQCTLLTVGQQVSVISKGMVIATVRSNGVKLFTAVETVK